MNTETQVTKLSIIELSTIVIDLQARITALELKLEPKKIESKEMTDEHARRVLIGDLAQVKHKEAAEQLGLTYGQVYSCRLQFTFKHIHKEMKIANKPNPWVK